MRIFLSLLLFVGVLSGCASTQKPALSVTSTIDKEAIRRAIKDNRKKFQACYDKALRRDTDTGGKIVIQWDIEQGGVAKKASVIENSTNDEKFGDCMATEIGKIKFPEPPNDQVARVKFPFIFDPAAK